MDQGGPVPRRGSRGALPRLLLLGRAVGRQPPAADAAARVTAGLRAFDVSNEPFLDAARALTRGASFPPVVLVGVRQDDLVCLEGHLRLTAHALAGFPSDVECLIGTAPDMGRWAR